MSSEVCKYFPKCKFGDRCRYKHPQEKSGGECTECALKGYHVDCWHCKGTGEENLECIHFNTKRGCLNPNCPFVHIRRDQRMTFPERLPQPPAVCVGQITIERVPDNTATLTAQISQIPHGVQFLGFHWG